MRTHPIWLAVLGALAAAGCAAADADLTTVRLGVPPAEPGTTKRVVPLPTAYVVEAKTALTVDGKLDEAAWRQAAPVHLDTMTGRGKPSAASEVRLLRREGQLFIGFTLDEPNVENMRRKVTKFDGPTYQDDSVEVFLSPRGGSSWAHFIVGAGGALTDLKDRNRSWNSGAKHGVHVGERSWSVELAIPFSVLNVKKDDLGMWRGNFYRSRHAGNGGENNAWSPTGRNDYDVPGRFGKIVFGPPPPPKPDEKKPTTAGKPAIVLDVANGRAVVRFDLSDLPEGRRVLRAELLLFRDGKVDGSLDEAMVETRVYPISNDFKAGGKATPAGKALPLVPPWYDRLDATEAVRDFAGAKSATFFIESCALLNAPATCLDIAVEAKPTAVPQQVTDVRAVHRAGQTFITWKEIRDPVGADEVTWGTMRAILSGLDKEERVRYCVYRHREPITPGNLWRAELLARVRPLSGWNVNARNIDRPVDHYIATANGIMTGHWNPFGKASINGPFGRDCPIERFVIEAGGKPLGRGTGLYVHTLGAKAAPGKAYYAVVTSVNGVLNSRDVSEQNTAPAREGPGVGEPVLQGVLPKMPFFNFEQKRLHYVRWVAPPLTNQPSEAHNWSVGVPEPLDKDVPLELNFHRDGHSFWRTHYRIERDSIVLCPYDFPRKTWWYGYHESLGTLRSFRQGVIQPFTERRLLAFVDWAAKKWPVDRDRVLVTGCRGGASGSGALHLALRHPDVFNLVIAGHPTINYVGSANDLGRRGAPTARSLRAIWGKPDWKLKTSEGGIVWEELDLNRRVAGLPASARLPYMTVTSNHGYAECRKFYETTLRKHFGIMAEFAWGGGRYIPVSNTETFPNVIRLDIRKDRPFLGCASAQGLKYATKGGMGGFNRNFRWKDVVDEAGRFEATLFTSGRGDATADVVPRRLRKFQVVKGRAYLWKTVGADGKELQKGEATVGDDGLLVLEGVKFAGRLTIVPKPEKAEP
jgi:hypothetical protein